MGGLVLPKKWLTKCVKVLFGVLGNLCGEPVKKCTHRSPHWEKYNRNDGSCIRRQCNWNSRLSGCRSMRTYIMETKESLSEWIIFSGKATFHLSRKSAETKSRNGEEQAEITVWEDFIKYHINIRKTVTITCSLTSMVHVEAHVKITAGDFIKYRTNIHNTITVTRSLSSLARLRQRQKDESLIYNTSLTRRYTHNT